MAELEDTPPIYSARSSFVILSGSEESWCPTREILRYRSDVLLACLKELKDQVLTRK